jgi:hypothetical protein
MAADSNALFLGNSYLALVANMTEATLRKYNLVPQQPEQTPASAAPAIYAKQRFHDLAVFDYCTDALTLS